MASNMLAELFVKVSARVADYKKDLGKIKTESVKAGQQIEKGLGGAFKGLGKSTAVLGGVAGAVAGLGSALKKGFSDLVRFDKAMRNVNSIMGLSNKEFKEMSSSVRKLASSLGADATDLANGLYQTASAGIATADAMDFLGVASKSAIAGLTSTETAVDGITTVLNSYKMSSESAQKVADVMFQTVKLGKTTFDQLSRSLANVLPIASASGISFEQVAGAMATMTKQGIPTAQATTQMRQAIIGLNKELGDGWAEQMTFAEASELVREKAGGSQTALIKMLGSVEAVSAVLAVSGKNAEGAGQDFEAMGASGGASAEALAEQMKSLDNQIKRVSASWSDILMSAIEFGMPLINDVTTAVQKLFGVFKDEAPEEISMMKVFEEMKASGADSADILKVQRSIIRDMQRDIIKTRRELGAGRGELQTQEQITRAIKSLNSLIPPEMAKVSRLQGRMANASEEERQILLKKIGDIYAYNQGTLDTIESFKALGKQMEDLKTFASGEEEDAGGESPVVVKTKEELKEIAKLKKAEQKQNQQDLDDALEMVKENDAKKLEEGMMHLANLKGIRKKSKEEEKEEEEAMVEYRKKLNQQITNFVGGNFGSAIRSMIQGGKTLKQAMDGIWQNMLSSFINKVSMMITEWLVLQALTGGTAGGSGGLLGLLGLQHGGKVIGAGGATRKAQTGASFNVPSGFQNDRFPVMVDSGEKVEVTSRGRTSNQEALLGSLIGRVEAMNMNLQGGARNDRSSKNIDVSVKGEIGNSAIKLSSDKGARLLERYR